MVSVDTGLERPVTEALRAGRDVVITGSAGGGKTQLVERVVELLAGSEPRLATHSWDDEGNEPGIRVIRDLTAVPAAVRAAALLRTSSTTAMLVAANEGTLGRITSGDFVGVLDLLHQMQQGVNPTKAGQPVVVDLAGYDPFATALPDLLGLDLLRDVVNTGTCCADPTTCPRRMAWAQLASPVVRRRVSDVLASAKGPGEVIFRDLWDFIADIALGGDCRATPPTSTWFWRVFFGDSVLSRQLRESRPPDLIAIPGDEIRLYYGDWMGVNAEPVEGAAFVWPTLSPVELNGAVARQGALNWLRVEIALLSDDATLVSVLQAGLETSLTAAVRAGQPEPLIAALNRYQRYNLSERVPEQLLELWVDLSVERRQLRPLGAFSLGSVPRALIDVGRSLLIGNWPETKSGARAFLRGPNGASLRLDDRLLAALARGRSVRLADREHDDIDWALWRFYVRMAPAQLDAPSTRLDVMTFGASFATVETHGWSIEAATYRVEPVA